MATVSAWPDNPHPNPNPNSSSSSPPSFLLLDPNPQPPLPSPSSSPMSQQSDHLYFDTNSDEPDSLSPPSSLPPIRTSVPENTNPIPNSNSPNSLSSSQPLTLLHVSFNQDFGCFSSGTDRGFRIYNCDPFREIFRRDFDRGGGIGKVEMLYRCNILALVGGGPEPQYPVNKVMIWDDHQSRCIGELSFRSEVRGVRLRRDRIVVVLEQKVFVYNFADLKLLHQIETSANPKGLCEVSQSAGKLVLVCPGLRKGQIRVEHYASRKTKFIMAHDSRVACFSLTQDGGLLATASSKGTLVRIFNTFDGTLLQEVTSIFSYIFRLRNKLFFVSECIIVCFFHMD